MEVLVSPLPLANQANAKSPGVDIVHAVSYSLLLLNTDLHVADLVSRMSKSQFVKNTLTAIQMQLQSDEPTSPSDGASNDDDSDFMRGSGSDYAATSQQTSPSKTQSKRSDSITSWNSVPRDVFIPSLTATSPGGPTNGSSPSVQISLASPDTKSSSGGVMSRAREIELENNLKVRAFISRYMMQYRFNALLSLTGHVHCCQEPADSSATDYEPTIEFFAESLTTIRDRSEQELAYWPPGSSDDSQTGKYSRVAVYHGHIASWEQPIQQSKQHGWACESITELCHFHE